MLSKYKLVFAERNVIFIAILVIFITTFYQLSLDGLLPGNDPAVHLKKAQIIIKNEGISYREIPWYPPLFHTFLATTLLLIGSVDVLIAVAILKLIMSIIVVFTSLSIYLLSRRFFERGVAISSLIFASLSIPVMEIISWGGYPNFTGLAYIILVFYVLFSNYSVLIKSLLLFLFSFTLVLTHQLVTFVFILIFLPTLLITSHKSKRGMIGFLSVIIGISIAFFFWYAQIILQYSNIFIEFLFFSMKEYLYNIPYVSLNSFIKIFGPSLFLAIIGVPLTFYFLIKKKKFIGVLFFSLWVFVPLFLSQSYFFGIFLPYERFIYFLATPLVILAGVTVYSFAKIIAIFLRKITLKSNLRQIRSNVFIFTLVMLILFYLQYVPFIKASQDFSKSYKVAGYTAYNVGDWLKEWYHSNGSVVVTRKPGSWLGTLVEQQVLEETNPLFGRNSEAETALYFFYEMDNGVILTREYVSGENSGQSLYISVNNLWIETVIIPDNSVFVNYIDDQGSSKVISLIETTKDTYWKNITPDNPQMVSRYAHSVFELEKILTITNQRINCEWIFHAKHNLSNVLMKIFNLNEPSLLFKEAFINELLEWKNPWDAPSRIDLIGNWSVVEYSKVDFNYENVAILDVENDLVTIYDFLDIPDILNIGALGDMRIDAVRTSYELGNISVGHSDKIKYSVILSFFERAGLIKSTLTETALNYKPDINGQIQMGDFISSILENKIEFMVIDINQLLSGVENSIYVNRIYNNDDFLIYKTHIERESR